MSMRFSFGQSQEMTQKQVMSPRQILSAELLQLPILQLEERLDQELQENPVLEIVQDSDREEEEGEEGEESIESGNGEDRDFLAERPEKEIDIRDEGDNREDFQTADDFSNLYPDTIDENPTRSRSGLEDLSDRHDDLINNAVSRGVTLADHLREQLSWFNLTPQTREICEKIIGNLDRFGFLLVPLESLAGENPSPEELDQWREGLEIIQKLDPAGVGARNEREALLLQLPEDLPDLPVVRTLISDHLNDLAMNRIPQIIRATGFSMAQIENALREIRRLNPRPGSGFDSTPLPPVLPDVVVERDDDGYWRVDVTNGNLPELCVSPHYKKMLKDKEVNREAKDYIRRNESKANWIIDAISRRKATLYRVTQAIVDHQRDFFEIGPERLRPLKMKQIAEELGIDFSTVSRACNDKWLQSPRGIFPLKRFFSGAAVTTGKEGGEGETLATERVKARIREMIDAEDKKSPLSDEEIASKLKEERGIEISRRTVAKYRDEMSLPSSRQRRDWGQKRK